MMRIGAGSVPIFSSTFLWPRPGRGFLLGNLRQNALIAGSRSRKPGAKLSRGVSGALNAKPHLKRLNMLAEINWGQWQFWLTVVMALMNIGVGFYVWFSNRDKARNDDLKEITTDAKKLETRVTQLEAASISHDDLGKVYDRINEVSDQVSELNGTMSGIKGSVDMIHEYLLNSNGGNQ